MRLLYKDPQGKFRLTEPSDDVPPYAILSHTWGADSDEVIFEDIRNETARFKPGGFAKLEFCAEQAQKDGLQYFWADTCCINKNSETELSEAIRSMFRWYSEAAQCYAYLSDVIACKRRANIEVDTAWEESFRRSRWFTRGWTLQELLAPQSIKFFSRERNLLGTRVRLRELIQEVTGIPTSALLGQPLSSFGTKERFGWAEGRQTKKVEDQAYCLSGIFGVQQLQIRYGEGKKSSMQQLRAWIKVTIKSVDEAIERRYRDGRLRVERISCELLPLDRCFVNLGIVHHSYDRDARSMRSTSSLGKEEKASCFSLAERLNIKNPPKSQQVMLSELFEPRIDREGNKIMPRRVLIWGRAGMGKTTLCKKIVHEIYENKLWSDLYDRVLWLPLRNLRRTAARTMNELVLEEFGLRGREIPVWKTIEELIQDERTLLLLDGLDEVSFTFGYHQPGKDLLHQLLSQPRVILTSRPHQCGAQLLGSASFDYEVETIGFYPRQVTEYLQQLVQVNSMTNTCMDEIQSFIKDRPLVQSLARIPIQLDAICHTWDTKDFPHDDMTMTKLYLAITQSLWKASALRLEKRDEGTYLNHDLLERRRWPFVKKLMSSEIAFVQQLAFHGLCQETIEFSDADIQNIHADVYVDKILHVAFLRMSDNHIDMATQTFHFIHLTFQEFFAAQYFVQLWISGRKIPLQDSNVHRDRGSNHQEKTPETSRQFVQSHKYGDRYNIFWRFVVGLLRHHHEQKYLHQLLGLFETEPTDLVGITHQRFVIHCLSELGPSANDPHGISLALEHRFAQWAKRQINVAIPPEAPDDAFLIDEIECPETILLELLDKIEREVVPAVLEAFIGRPSISITALYTLQKMLSTSNDRDERHWIFKNVGKHCDHNSSQVLFELFDDSNRSSTFVDEIVSAWIDVDLGEAAVQRLSSLLQDQNHNLQLRLEARRILNRYIESPECADDVVAAVKEYDKIQQLKTNRSNMQLSPRLTTVKASSKELPSTTNLHRTEWGIIIESVQRLRLCNVSEDRVTHLLQSERTGRWRSFVSLSDDILDALITILRSLHGPLSYLSLASQICHKIEHIFVRQTSLSYTILVRLLALIQSPQCSQPYDLVRFIESILLGNHELPDIAFDVLITMLRDTNVIVHERAALILFTKHVLSKTAVDAIVEQLQILHHEHDYNDLGYLVDMLLHQRQLRIQIPTFHWRVLRQVILLFMQDLDNRWVQLTIAADCLYIEYYGVLDQVQLSPGQMQTFKQNWQSARRDLEIPRLPGNDPAFDDPAPDQDTDDTIGTEVYKHQSCEDVVGGHGGEDHDEE